MKAQNLRDAYKAFDPTPLEETEIIESFFINRGGNLVKLFTTFPDQPVKVLFSGHRGSGKTTELNYSENALSDKYTVLNLQVGKFLDSDKIFDCRGIIKAILYAVDTSRESRDKTKKTLQTIIKGFRPITGLGLGLGVNSNYSAKEYISDASAAAPAKNNDYFRIWRRTF